MPATQQIVEQVERLTNRPVHIQEDASLGVLAHMRVARGDAPLHLLRYKPMGVVPPDYLIAYQCGFVVRLFETPPSKRFDYGTDDDGRRKFNDLFSDARFLPAVRSMADRLLGELVTQLRSIPIGLRVDKWLLAQYPDLIDLQARGTRAQLEQNVPAIAIGSKGLFPAKVWKANVTMNAAFAAFWSREWNDPALVLPYKAAGLLDGGIRLLGIFDTVPSDPACDPDLVEQWAFALGMKGWYGTTPYYLND